MAIRRRPVSLLTFLGGRASPLLPFNLPRVVGSTPGVGAFAPIRGATVPSALIPDGVVSGFAAFALRFSVFVRLALRIGAFTFLALCFAALAFGLRSLARLALGLVRPGFLLLLVTVLSPLRLSVLARLSLRIGAFTFLTLCFEALAFGLRTLTRLALDLFTLSGFALGVVPPGFAFLLVPVPSPFRLAFGRPIALAVLSLEALVVGVATGVMATLRVVVFAAPMRVVFSGFPVVLVLSVGNAAVMMVKRSWQPVGFDRSPGSARVSRSVPALRVPPVVLAGMEIVVGEFAHPITAPGAVEDQVHMVFAVRVDVPVIGVSGNEDFCCLGDGFPVVAAPVIGVRGAARNPGGQQARGNHVSKAGPIRRPMLRGHCCLPESMRPISTGFSPTCLSPRRFNPIARWSGYGGLRCAAFLNASSALRLSVVSGC